MQAAGRTTTLLTLQFRSDKLGGIIFFAGVAGSDFFTLELLSGKLVYHVSLGSAPAQAVLGSINFQHET